MSAMYRQEQQPSYSPSSSQGSSWNQFQHDHAGLGLSSSQMSAMYHQEQRHQQPAATAAPARPAASPSSSSASQSEWNDFQSKHAGMGLSSTEMSKLYHAQRASSTASAAASDLRKLAVSDTERRENQWNTFQKLMKSSALSADERRQLYHDIKDSKSIRPAIAQKMSAPPPQADDWTREYMEQCLARQEFAEQYFDIDEVAVPEQPWSAFAAAPTSPPELRIPAEDIVLESKPVGKGAFGDVFAGVLRKSTLVAVKSMSIVSKKSLELFVTELRILASLDHPNVVKLLGYTSIASGKMAMVIEFMSGGSLWDQLHGVEVGEFDPTARRTVARQVTAALAYLHSHPDNIAHRDIKSRNVLLHALRPGAPVMAKLCDFGLVAFRNQQASSVASHGDPVFVGTPAYAAPEIFREEVGDDDVPKWQSCDIYSMGVLLWEIATGDEPFFGKSPASIKRSVCNGERLPWPDTVPRALAALKTAIDVAWAHDAAVRPPAIRLRGIVAEACA
jgi:hypothetical protein